VLVSEDLTPREWDRRFRTDFLASLPRVLDYVAEKAILVKFSLEGSYIKTVLTFSFTHTQQPGCVFVWPYPVEFWLEGYFEHAGNDPEWVAMMIRLNFEELIDATNFREMRCGPDGQFRIE